MKTKQNQARVLCANASELQKLNAEQRLAWSEKAVNKYLRDYEKKCGGFISSLNQRAKSVVEAWSFVRPSLVTELGGADIMLADIKRVAFDLAKSGLCGKNAKGEDVPAVWVDSENIDTIKRGIEQRGQNFIILDDGKEVKNSVTRWVGVVDKNGDKTKFKEQKTSKVLQIKIAKVVWSLRDVNLAVRYLVARSTGKTLDEARAAQFVRDGATIEKKQNKTTKKVELTANDLNESSEPKQVQQTKDKKQTKDKSGKNNKGAANSNEGEK